MRENKPNIPGTWMDPDDAPSLMRSFSRKRTYTKGTDRFGVAGVVPSWPAAKCCSRCATVRRLWITFGRLGEGWQSRMDAVLREYVRRKV